MCDGLDGFSMAWSLNFADECRERKLLDRVQASDPSERIKQCIAFLFTISHIEVADTIKNANGDTSFVINVLLNDSADKSEATATSFQIQRTFKEFKELRHVSEHWSKKHPYGKCSYCQYFESGSSLPGVLSHLTKSKEKMERQLQEFLNGYASHARLPRPSKKECQGFDHIPSVFTRFLIKDLPQPDADDAEQQKGEENQLAEVGDMKSDS